VEFHQIFKFNSVGTKFDVKRSMSQQNQMHFAGILPSNTIWVLVHI